MYFIFILYTILNFVKISDLHLNEKRKMNIRSLLIVESLKRENSPQCIGYIAIQNLNGSDHNQSGIGKLKSDRVCVCVEFMHHSTKNVKGRARALQIIEGILEFSRSLSFSFFSIEQPPLQPKLIIEISD